MGKLWLIDAGHGGLTPSGNYTTAPAKMYKFPDGLTVYEGVVNRKIASKLMRRLGLACINHLQIHDEIADISLEARVEKANKVFKSDSSCVYLSIHSNASPDPKKPGKGLEVFTSIGQTKSDKVADVICKKYLSLLPQFPLRCDKADGDLDKEANFYVLRKTNCPSVLVENLFFDNRAEAEYLLSDAGQENIAEVLFQAIRECENLKL